MKLMLDNTGCPTNRSQFVEWAADHVMSAKRHWRSRNARWAHVEDGIGECSLGNEIRVEIHVLVSARQELSNVG